MPTIQFKGKNIIWNHHLSVPYHTLDEVEDLHYQPKKGNGNLIIEGDNLIALKALLPQYAGKVKCIYIDPPYNTGDDNGKSKGWVYNDNVNSPLIQKWIGKEVGADDLTKHDKWMCMIVPRLKMLKDLLAEDGLLIIHIDENEYHRLQSLLEELFDGANNLGTVIWNKKNPKGDTKKISYQHESIMVYCKNFELVKGKLKKRKKNADKILEVGEKIYSKLGKETYPNDILSISKKYKIDLSIFEDCKIVYDLELINNEFKDWLKSQDFTGGEKAYKFIDEEGQIFRGVSMAWPNKIKAPDEYFIPLIHPITKKECPVPEKGWRNPPDTMKRLEDNKLILFGEDEKTQPERKYVLKENLFENISSIIGFGGSDDAFQKEIGIKFENPKPYKFSKEIIDWFSDKNSIILDSFAGSGTTMHAVNELNKEDGGNRKCILVQMTEASPQEPKKNICKDITRERNKLAIEKYGYNTGFKYFRVGKAIDPDKMLDGELPTYEEFAKYVYYIGTGQHLVNTDKLDAKSHYVGTHGPKNFYLIYKQDFDKLTRMALTLSIAEKIIKHSKNKRIVVYAPACFLDNEYLEEKQIEFVSIPYNLFEKTVE